MGYARGLMSKLVLPLRARLDTLPLVLAGPVVRRVDAETVTVWIALRRPALVRLEVRSGDDLMMDGARATVPLGEHLHVVAVTAKGRPLTWGESYGYQLYLDEGRDLYAPGVVAAQPDEARAMLTYPGGPKLPSFVLPPAEIARLHVVQGSCRRPHKNGQDALPYADMLIEAAVTAGNSRPHMLFITGDHIYADSMSELLLLMVADIGHTLLGWRELLPGVERYADEIAPSERRTLMRTEVRHPEPDRYQLFGLGEFYAMHLLVIAQALWPASIVNYRGPDRDAERLAQFAGSLPAVRRALANIATYSTFDDHEVCDDWNLTLDWCKRVYGQPLGRRMAQNGLLAFALFAAWGNMPDEFAPPDPADASLGIRRGYALLGDVAAWRPVDVASSVSPADLHLLARLAIPANADALFAHGHPPRLTHGETAIDWHFHMRTPAFELIALDTRSLRAFPGKDDLDLPELISSEGIARQLSAVSEPSDGLLLLVISATPIIYMPISPFGEVVANVVEAGKALVHLVRGDDRPWVRARVYDPDRGDEWLPQMQSFGELIDRLLRGRDAVAFSGDWHLGYGAVLTHGEGKRQAMLVQCTSGGFLNEDFISLRRHKLGYKVPWPFPSSWPVEVRGATPAGPYRIQWLRSAGASPRGCELVGKNNLGEVRFASTERGTDVIYSVWYCEDDSAPAEPHTRFTATLPRRGARE